jgi:hypothetical protein
MLREAAALWVGLTRARGAEGRDALWAHPDLLPTAADLEEPEAFVGSSSESSDLDISDFEDDTDDTGGEDGTSN